MGAVAASEQRAKKKMKEALEKIEPLPWRMSELLQYHRGRRLSAADDRILQIFRLVVVELRDIAASLDQPLPLLDLRPYHVENYELWLLKLRDLARYIGNHLDKYERFITRKEQETYERTACFRCDSEFRLPHPDVTRLIEEELSWINGQPYRYEHLMLAGDDDSIPLSGMPQLQPYATEARTVARGDLLVGIEGIRKKLLRWFTPAQEDNMALSIVSMVGPAGVGKTALANELYRHLQQIGGDGPYFECCALANVSPRPCIKVLLRHILCQIDKQAAIAPASISTGTSEITMSEDGEDQDEQELVCNINQYLQDRRYLIVIDDLWKESDWDIISSALPRNNRGSRIIVTTRIRSVAWYTCCSNGLMHEVKPLNELDSQMLLLQSVFGSKNGLWPDNLKQSRDEILRRCQGIPFFISGMADWLREQEEVQKFYSNGSLDCLLEEAPQFPRLLKQFEQTLYPTYDDLPYWSKVLLLYMSMFPEGYMFNKDNLIRKWIAKGLSGSYEEAEACFSMLIDRNVVTRAINIWECTPQVEEDCHWQVNYFMLQFLAYRLDDKGFACASGMRAASPEAMGNKKLRWLSVNQPDRELEMLLSRRSNLSHFHNARSLSISGAVDDLLFPLDKFIYLVVLDLEGWQCFKDEDMLLICSSRMLLLRYLSVKNTRVRKLPAKIKELRSLETLDMSHTEVSELPSEACELSRLETLDLRSTLVRQLPEQIRKMRSMRHLLIGDYGVGCNGGTTIPDGIGCLLDLRTLATVHLSVCSARLVEALGGMEKLTELAITWSFHQCSDRRYQEALHCSFQKWRGLKSLSIHGGQGSCVEFLDSLPDQGRSNDLEKLKVTGGGRFVRLPQWFQGLDCLAFVEITVLRLVTEDLSILTDLPSLEHLSLGLDFLPEEAIVIGRAGFRKLERLCIGCRFPWLTCSQGAMQRLRYLEMKIGGHPVSRSGSVLAGINNLCSVSEVSIHYNVRYSNNRGVILTIETVRKEVAEHLNPISVFVNGIQDQDENFEAVAGISGDGGVEGLH